MQHSIRFGWWWNFDFDKKMDGPLLVNCKWGIWTILSHENCTAQWHVYIPRQRMPEDVGRLTPHVTSLPLVLSFSLPQLPPPAPLWKPPLMEPSLAQSILLDMRSISLVPKATILAVLPRVFAGTMAPGLALVLFVKVSSHFWPCMRPVLDLIRARNAVSVCFHHRIRSFSPLCFSPHTNRHP